MPKQSPIYLLLLCLGLCHLTALIQLAEADDPSLKRIENYLVTVETSDSGEKNLVKVKEWLQKGGHSSGVGESLKLLVTLEDTQRDPIRCTWDSYSILQANDLATGELIQRNKVPVRRVDKIVHQYALKHALACDEVYPSRFAIRSRQLDHIQLQRLEAYIDKLIKASINLPPSNSQFKLHLDHEFCKKIILNSKRRAFNALVQLTESEDDPDAKLLESRPSSFLWSKVVTNKLEQLFTKYLLQPCRYYNSKLAADVFLPAQFDAALHSQVIPARRDFYEGWARFRFCQVLQTEHSQLLQDVLNLARDRATESD